MLTRCVLRRKSLATLQEFFASSCLRGGLVSGLYLEAASNPRVTSTTMSSMREKPLSDCGLRIADCGLPIADCGLSIADCGFSFSNPQSEIHNPQSTVVRSSNVSLISICPPSDYGFSI